jgi:hypothetical protein
MVVAARIAISFLCMIVYNPLLCKATTPSELTWQRVSLLSSPPARTDHAQAAIPSGMLIHGGTIRIPVQTTADFWLLSYTVTDGVTVNWIPIRQLGGFNSSVPHQRAEHCMSSCSDTPVPTLLMYGGYSTIPAANPKQQYYSSLFSALVSTDQGFDGVVTSATAVWTLRSGSDVPAPDGSRLSTTSPGSRSGMVCRC